MNNILNYKNHFIKGKNCLYNFCKNACNHRIWNEPAGYKIVKCKGELKNCDLIKALKKDIEELEKYK